jgi:hypothetical protein
VDNAWVEETVIPIYDEINGLARGGKQKVLKIEVRMVSWIPWITWMDHYLCSIPLFSSSDASIDFFFHLMRRERKHTSPSEA